MSSRPRPTTKLSSRFLLYYAVSYLVLIGLMAIVADRATRTALIEDVDENLMVSAQIAAESIPADSAEYQAWAQRIFVAGGMRTTLIGVDGVVLADSHSDPAVLENHLERPEVQVALTGEVGEDQRVSDSTGFEQRYVAIPPVEGLIVRTSLPTRVVDDRLSDVRSTILIAAAVLGLVGILVVAVLARRLTRPIGDLTAQALAVAEGQSQISPRRSRVWELDQLGLAISTLADRVGSRLADAEQTTATLEVVLGALSQGTILFDGANRVLYANPSAYTILGAVPDELAGLAPLQLQNAVRDAREKRGQEVRELDHGTPTRRLRAVATPFTGDERVLLLVVDITERERTDSIRRDFVANASHELKTPVSTIIASSEALQIALERHDDSASGFATRIEHSARQLDRLVADLLDLSRLEKDQPELAPLRIDHLVREEVERIRGDAEAKGLSVELTLEAVTAMANHRDIAIGIRNLLDNAIRYTPEGGSLTVSVARDSREAVISVTDTGEGIPTRDTERVFERFYRVDSARSRATGGTGLGLSIVKHVAESHGGSVSVESELGVGSTFAIRLPIDEEGEAAGDN
ncbi:MAG TPA: ATP-binding protein [Acidimicrobiia bacterium]|nr:ATP-binding protein [Acidimicrobiia bacterium]